MFDSNTWSIFNVYKQYIATLETIEQCANKYILATDKVLVYKSLK